MRLFNCLEQDELRALFSAFCCSTKLLSVGGSSASLIRSNFTGSWLVRLSRTGTGGAGRVLLDFFLRFRLFMSADEALTSLPAFVRFVLRLLLHVSVVISELLL